MKENNTKELEIPLNKWLFTFKNSPKFEIAYQKQQELYPYFI